MGRKEDLYYARASVAEAVDALDDALHIVPLDHPQAQELVDFYKRAKWLYKQLAE